MLKGLKFKTPARESEELRHFYDLVFSPETFCASWAGCVGHYAYFEPNLPGLAATTQGYIEPNSPGGAATNQDGFIYLWPMPWISDEGHYWYMSADPQVAHTMCSHYVEVIL